jgi:hypothetical protein
MDSGLSVDGFTTFHGAEQQASYQPLNETKVIFETALFGCPSRDGAGCYIVVTDDPNDSLCHVSGDCSVDVVHRLEHIFVS